VSRGCARPGVALLLAVAGGLPAGVAAAIESQTATPARVCRTYATDEVSTVTGSGAGSIRQTCHFAPSQLEQTCRVESRTEAGTFTLTDVQTYASVADFVDEVRVVPPLFLAQRETRRFTNLAGSDADITFERDTAGRQTRAIVAINGQQIVMTYSDWDAKGRPMTETSRGVTAPITLHHAYDDDARTTTTTGPSGADTKTFDANGNMIREVSGSGKAQTVDTIAIAKTETICR